MQGTSFVACLNEAFKERVGEENVLIVYNVGVNAVAIYRIGFPQEIQVLRYKKVVCEENC